MESNDSSKTLETTPGTDSAPNRDPMALLPAEVNLDAAFRREHPLAWWATLVGPLLLTLLILAVLWEINGAPFVGRLVTTAVATFFFFGKFVILGGSAGDLLDVREFYTAEQLVVMVLYMDVMTASVLAFHLGFLFRLPVAGGKLKALVDDGQFILQSNRWMKRATFFGLVAFVMFPLAATGSVGGSIFGRLLGMSRLGTFMGITLGNILGCALLYFGSEVVTRYVGRDSPVLLVGGITVIAVIILMLNHRYRQLKARQTTAVRDVGCTCGADPHGKTSCDQSISRQGQL